MAPLPLAVSIAERVAFGLIAYILLKTVAGRTRAVPLLLYVFAALFLGRYALLS